MADVVHLPIDVAAGELEQAVHGRRRGLREDLRGAEAGLLGGRRRGRLEMLDYELVVVYYRLDWRTCCFWRSCRRRRCCRLVQNIISLQQLVDEAREV